MPQGVDHYPKGKVAKQGYEHGKVQKGGAPVSKPGVENYKPKRAGK